MQTVSEPSIFTILMVHGTFAREAAWTREGSSMYAALSRRFPEARLERFQWSGANSVFERGDASKALLNDLGSRLNNGQRVYVVAHSHGGNVALNAITHLEPSEIDQVALCCLATPFFEARKRQTERLGGQPLIWGFSGIAIVLSALVNVALM
jgi:pimeloyl-ACP methyl ester carboxylesterase